jgi:integrase
MLEKLREHSGDIVYPIIFVITHTGARREEIRALKWADVDFENGFIILRKTKNGRVRRIKMALQVREFLMRQPHRNDYVFTAPCELLPSKATIEYHV